MQNNFEPVEMDEHFLLNFFFCSVDILVDIDHQIKIWGKSERGNFIFWTPCNSKSELEYR